MFSVHSVSWNSQTSYFYMTNRPWNNPQAFRRFQHPEGGTWAVPPVTLWGLNGRGRRQGWGALNSWTRVASLWHTTLGSGHLPGAIPHCQPWTFTLQEESLLWPWWKRPRFYMQRQFCHWSSVSPRTGGQPWQAWPGRGFRMTALPESFTLYLWPCKDLASSFFFHKILGSV